MRFLIVVAAVSSLAAHASGEPKVSLRLEAEGRQRVAEGLVVRASIALERIADAVALPRSWRYLP